MHIVLKKNIFVSCLSLNTLCCAHHNVVVWGSDLQIWNFGILFSHFLCNSSYRCCCLHLRPLRSFFVFPAVVRLSWPTSSALRCPCSECLPGSPRIRWIWRCSRSPASECCKPATSTILVRAIAWGTRHCLCSESRSCRRGRIFPRGREALEGASSNTNTWALGQRPAIPASTGCKVCFSLCW